MSISGVEVNRVNHYICDSCGKHADSPDVPEGWLEFTYTEVNALRLMEKKSNFRYESFNIPKQGLKQFCALPCARTFLTRSVELFLTELAPVKKPLNHKELK